MATHPQPTLIDTEHILEAAAGIVAWFETYAGAGRAGLTERDYESWLAAAAPLEPIARLAGPVGDAAHVLLVGGAGYATDEIHDALDVLDQLVNPHRHSAAPWHQHAAPAEEPTPPPRWIEVPLPGI